MYLGIDISKDSLDCYKLTERSAKRFSNDEQGVEALVPWLGTDTELHVVMEATGVYWQACAFALYQQGVKVSVVNPAQVKYFARSHLRRGKTDRMDAELLAHYAQTMQPERWQPASPCFEELKLLVRERDDIVTQLGQLYNQLHAHQHRQHCPDTLLDLLTQRIKLLKAQRKSLDQAISEHCEQTCADVYTCLRSVPGIGSVAASVLLAEAAGLNTFEHPKQLTAFAGISPAPNQSGTFTGHSSISKIGNSRIRKAFYMAALQAKRHSVFKNLYERLIKKGKKPKVALIAVARKLLVIAFALVKSNQRFDPNHLSKAQALTIL